MLLPPLKFSEEAMNEINRKFAPTGEKPCAAPVLTFYAIPNCELENWYGVYFACSILPFSSERVNMIFLQ